jgi:hypothetical protein
MSRDDAIAGRRARRFEDHPFLYIEISISVIGRFRRVFLMRNWTEVAELLSYLGVMGLYYASQE